MLAAMMYDEFCQPWDDEARFNRNAAFRRQHLQMNLMLL
jgi:hypothetical protein